MSNSALAPGKRGVGRLGKGDPVGCARSEVDHPELGEPVLALEEHVVALEEVRALEHHLGPCGHHLLPVLAAGARDRRLHQAEGASLVVHADVEEVAVVIDVVLLLGDARGHDRPLAVGLVRGQEAGLGRGVAADAHDQVAEAPRPADPHVERLVLLFVDEVVRAGSEHVPVDPIRALRRFVFHGVEERPVVRGPGHGADLLRDRLQDRSGSEVLHVQGVLAEAGVVGRVGEALAVVAHHVAAEAHELLPFGQLVQVEGDLLGSFEGLRLAAVDRVLLALFRARVVPEGALAVGDVHVRLLDPREHLLVERVLEGDGGLHHRVGVGVLGLQVGRHVGVRLVAQPEVVVHAPVAVDLVDLRDPLGDGRTGKNRRAFVTGQGIDERRRHKHQQNESLGHVRSSVWRALATGVGARCPTRGPEQTGTSQWPAYGAVMGLSNRVGSHLGVDPPERVRRT